MGKIRIVKGKSDVYQACVFSKYNVDITTGCATSIPIGREGRCKYCYARLWNFREFNVKADFSLFDKQVKNLGPVFKNEKWIRFGKMTDPGYIASLPILKQAIKKLNENRVHSIIATKLLGYDSEIADLLKDNGIIQYSFGYDNLELGAVKLGFSNKERLKHAIKYRNSGVVTIARVVIDVTSPPNNIYNEIKGKLPILITPIRFRKKSLAKEIGADLNNYAYYRGYYRPLLEKEHREFVNKPTCGDFGKGEERCALCLTNIFRKKQSDNIRTIELFWTTIRGKDRKLFVNVNLESEKEFYTFMDDFVENNLKNGKAFNKSYLLKALRKKYKIANIVKEKKADIIYKWE